MNAALYNNEVRESDPARHQSSQHYEKRRDLVYRIAADVESQIKPPFRDISQGFAEGLTRTAYDASSEMYFPTRKESLEYFEKEFMRREIGRVKGNLTQYVRDAFDADDESSVNNLRRNVYRKIEKYCLSEDVDAARPWKPNVLEQRIENEQSINPGQVEDTLTTILAGYKDRIHPSVYDELSETIKEKSPVLAQRISEYMPTPSNRLNEIMQQTEGMKRYGEARNVFERQIIYDAMQATEFDKGKAAEYLGDSVRTLNRRIEALGIEFPTEKNTAVLDDKTAGTEEPASTENKQTAAGAESEVDRLRQLVREYNAKREEARRKKEAETQRIRRKTRDRDVDEILIAA